MPMLRRRRWLLIALTPLLLLALIMLSSDMWIPRLLTYLGQDWRVKVEQSDLQLWNGQWQLSGLAAGDSEKPITLSHITLNWSWAGLWQQRLRIGVKLGEIDLPLDPDALTLGGWTLAQWQAPLQPNTDSQTPATQDQQASETEGASEWQLELTGLELEQLTIELPKERWPEAPILMPLSTGEWASHHPNDPVPFHLTLLQNPDAYLDIRGEVRLASLQGSGDIQFQQLDLSPWFEKFALPLQQGLLDGSLNVQTQGLSTPQHASVQIKSDLKLTQLSGHFPSPIQQADLAQFRWQGLMQWTPQQDDTFQMQGRLTTQAFSSDIAQWDAASWEGRSRWNGRTDVGLEDIDIEGVLTVNDLEAQYTHAQQPVRAQLDALHWAQQHTYGTQTLSGSLRMAGLETTITPASLSLNQLEVPNFQLTPETLDIGQVTLAQFQVSPTDQPEVLHQLDQVQLQQMHIDWAQHDASIHHILLGAAHHKLTLNDQNQLMPWQSWVGQWQSQLSGPTPSSDTAPNQSAQDPNDSANTSTDTETSTDDESIQWHWQVASVQITSPWQIQFNHQALKRPWQTQLSIDKAQIGPLDSAHTPTDFDLDARLDQDAHIQVTGQLQPNPNQLTLNADIKGLDAASITPYTETYSGLEINNGRFNANVSLKQQGERLEGRAILDLYRLNANPVSEADASRLKRLLNMPVSSLIDVLEDDEQHIHLELPIHKTESGTDVGLSDVILLATRRAAEQATVFYLGQMLQPWATVYTVGKFAYNQTEKMLRVDLPPLAFTPASTTLTADHRQYLDQVTKVLNERQSLGLRLCAGTGQQEQALLIALTQPDQASEKAKALIQALQPIEEARQNITAAQQASVEATSSRWARLRMQKTRSALLDRGVSSERLFLCTQPGQPQSQEDSHVTVKLQD